MDLHELLADVMTELRQEDEAQALEGARRFLRDLDPESQEGLWFEALAESFPDRLAAALSYVRTVKR